MGEGLAFFYVSLIREIDHQLGRPPPQQPQQRVKEGLAFRIARTPDRRSPLCSFVTSVVKVLSDCRQSVEDRKPVSGFDFATY